MKPADPAAGVNERDDVEAEGGVLRHVWVDVAVVLRDTEPAGRGDREDAGRDLSMDTRGRAN